MNTHTPGPWVVDSQYPSEVQTTDLKSIASFWHDACEGRRITICGVNDCSPEESAANAMLASAAPDLLEALIKIADHYDMDGYAAAGYGSWKSLALEMAGVAKEAIEKAGNPLFTVKPEPVYNGPINPVNQSDEE
jgi:hypothetical protein